MAEGWFLVDTVGDLPAVLLIGARSKQWRPLSNEFRGSVHRTVLRLVETVLNNLKQSQVLIDLAGPRLALASPVLGPTRQVHGVLMWIGDPTATPPREPATSAWEWDLSDRVAPRLVPDPRGTVEPGRTLTDWLSTLARPADAARIAVQVRGAEVGSHDFGEWVEPDGAVHRYAHHCVATFDGPRVIGVSVELPERLPADDPDLAAHLVTAATARAGGVAPALVDSGTGRVLAWLSAVRPMLPATALNGAEPGPAPLTAQPLPAEPELLLATYPADPAPGRQ